MAKTAPASKVLHLRKYAAESDSFPKPLAGIRIGSVDAPGVPPAVTGISTTIVEQGQAEGWLTLVDPAAAVFAAGPIGRPLAKTHTFVHATEVVFHTLDGDVTYRVTRNPGKYTAAGELADPSLAGDPTAEVHADYRLALKES